VGHQQDEEEEDGMPAIFKHVLITHRNFQRIRAGIVPVDQREAIRPGIIITHFAFTSPQGQPGFVVISHTTQRAGICFADRRSEWGTWSEQSGTITTDGGRLYNRVGETVFEVGDQSLGQGKPPAESCDAEYAEDAPSESP
jgi:hypothetical protein